MTNANSEFQQCQTTGLWMGFQSPQSGNTFAHVGARVLRDPSKTSSENLLLFLALILGFLPGIILFVFQFIPTWREFALPSAGIVSLISIGLINLPLLVVSARRASKTIFDTLLQLDFAIGVFLAVFAIEVLLSNQNSKIVFAWSKEIWLPAFFGSLWILLRMTESHLFRARFKDAFANTKVLWPQMGLPIANYRRWQIALFFGGLLLVFAGGALHYFRNPQHFSYTLSLAAILPVLLPWPYWILNRLLAEAQLAHCWVGDFSVFRKLRNFKFLAFHHSGVLTSGPESVDEYWFHPSEAWSKEEIEDILCQLAGHSKHPLSQLIAQKFSSEKRKSLVHFLKVEEIPYLGLEASFKDLSGGRAIAVLGGLTWHKILQHEIDPEGMERIKRWKQEAGRLVLLSLNREIVAAIKIKEEERPELNADLKTFKRFKDTALGLASTRDIPRVDQLLNEGFNDVADDLLPVERNMQFQFWKERKTPMLEVLSTWDRSQAQCASQIYFCKADDEINAAKIKIVDGRILGLNWALKASRRISKSLPITTSILLIAAAALAFINMPWPTLITFLALYALGVLSASLPSIQIGR